MDLIEEYKQEILGKISDLKNANDDEEIMALVKEYEDRVRKEYQDKKDVEINSLEIKYVCLCELQKREEEAKEVENKEIQENEVESTNNEEITPAENIGETTAI